MAVTQSKPSESILAAGLMLEGKIEGHGNIRVAGRFRGNVNVDGGVTIEPGASVEGEVKADTVLVGGKVSGQIIAQQRVELRASGALIGDVKAESLIVAAGSKMRGNVEFGCKEGEVPTTALPGGRGLLDPDERAVGSTRPPLKLPA